MVESKEEQKKPFLSSDRTGQELGSAQMKRGGASASLPQLVTTNNFVQNENKGKEK